MSYNGNTPTTLEGWRQLAAECIRQIQQEHYYLPQWEAVRDQRDLREFSNKQAMLKQFQDFWEVLPDSREIHRPPFSLICDLATEYCFGEPGDEAASARTLDQALAKYTPGDEPGVYRLAPSKPEGGIPCPMCDSDPCICPKGWKGEE